jgi:hypothetical protein
MEESLWAISILPDGTFPTNSPGVDLREQQLFITGPSRK